MKENTCNYSDNWKPYIGDYDKFEYDIVLKDGTLVENCYPNGGIFNSISDEHNQKGFSESLVSEIRFSERPRYGINSGVSERPQYEWLDTQTKKRLTIVGARDFGGIYAKEAMQVAKIIEEFSNEIYYPYQAPKSIRNKVAIPVRNSKTNPKIGRNEPCHCESGKKYKHCCIRK